VRTAGLFVCVIAAAGWLPHLGGAARWVGLLVFMVLIVLMLQATREDSR
jgi:hypothetical protein